MIKKETIKKTRDFLNTVRTNLSLINEGHATISDIATAMEVSKARFGAAHELRLFEVNGRNGHRLLYRCNVPYVNETMAEEVIRCEYDAAAAKRRSVGANKSTDDAGRVHEHTSRTLNMITDWLREKGFEGIIYKQQTAWDNGIKVVL